MDFDGKLFRETSNEHTIEKFYRVKQITTLKVFSLKYHLSEKLVKAHLAECSRKFLSIMDVHLCEYEGKAFYIEKERVIEIFIKSRVVVDAVYFREENPNYTRPNIKESNESSSNCWHYIDLGEVAEKASFPTKGKGMDPSKVEGNDLLIYSPTVPKFNLSNSRWDKHLILLIPSPRLIH